MSEQGTLVHTCTACGGTFPSWTERDHCPSCTRVALPATEAYRRERDRWVTLGCAVLAGLVAGLTIGFVLGVGVAP